MSYKVTYSRSVIQTVQISDPRILIRVMEKKLCSSKNGTSKECRKQRSRELFVLFPALGIETHAGTLWAPSPGWKKSIPRLYRFPASRRKRSISSRWSHEEGS